MTEIFTDRLGRAIPDLTTQELQDWRIGEIEAMHDLPMPAHEIDEARRVVDAIEVELEFRGRAALDALPPRFP